MKKFAVAFFIASGIALAGFVTHALAMGPGHQSVEVKSGNISKVTRHWSDAGIPFNIRLTKQPSHGKVTLQTATETFTTRRGEVKTTRVTRISYQSKSGYTGQDNFTYVRGSGDASDRMSGEYTVAVTVK